MSHNIPEQFKKGYKVPFQTQSSSPGQQHKLKGPDLIDDVTADGNPYKPAGKLEERVAIITGADSGIGRATAILFALEGADLTLHATKQEESDMQDVLGVIEQKTGRRRKITHVLSDLRSEDECKKLVQTHLDFHGRLDTLVLNHATQQAVVDITKLESSQWIKVFETNIHSFFYVVKAAVPALAKSPYATITFDASINFAIGHPELLDYTATKGAIIAFMRALSNQVVGAKGIRCNAVAPGPIWTPLIPATMTEESIKTFGTSTPMGRAGQPVEIATCFVFLASADSSYVSGQVLHVNGGTVIN